MLQSCPTLCNLMDCSPPGSPICGILQARILGLPCPPPGDLPDPRIEHASLTSPPLADGFFTTSTYLGSPPDQGLNRRKFRVLTPGPPGKSSNIYFKCTLLWISLSNTIYKIMGLDQSLVSSRALLYSTAGGQPDPLGEAAQAVALLALSQAAWWRN